MAPVFRKFCKVATFHIFIDHTTTTTITSRKRQQDNEEYSDYDEDDASVNIDDAVGGDDSKTSFTAVPTWNSTKYQKNKTKTTKPVFH